ncbi:MAG: glycosyltransferase family 8 protein [Gemmatimonadales bacterium]|nr:glycosyltransferase family 8 protein [Gemmatimonadales bacterium]
MSGTAPPVHPAAVAFACDQRYLKYALFAAVQVAERHPARDFDIVIASAEPLVLPAIAAQHGIRHEQVDVAGRFDRLPLDDRRTAAAWLRLALPDALGRHWHRLLYLDADVYVQGGDIAALLRLDLGGHAVGAVRDNMQWRTPGRMPPVFRRLGLAHARFCNSGVLLLDVATWRRERVLERALDLASAHDPATIGLDQDLLNATLHGAWAELSPRWNWQYTWASRLFEALEDANVVHFIGPTKPWTHAGGELPLRFRRAYRAFFARWFPDDPPLGPDGPAPHHDLAYVRRVLAKHLLASGPTCRYLARFDSDLAVLA